MVIPCSLIFLLFEFINGQYLSETIDQTGMLRTALNFIVTVLVMGILAVGVLYCCHCFYSAYADAENNKLFLENFTKSEVQIKLDKINCFLRELDMNNKAEKITTFKSKCLICFENFQESPKKLNGAFEDPHKEPLIAEPIERELSTLPLCEHTFHKSCIKEWYSKVGKMCPICLNKIDEEIIDNTPRMKKKIINLQKNIHPELKYFTIDYENKLLNYEIPSHLEFKS